MAQFKLICARNHFKLLFLIFDTPTFLRIKMQNHLPPAILCAPKKSTPSITKLAKLLITVGVLSMPYSAAFAACDPFGNITGTNTLQINLPSAGCGDAPGNTSANVASGAVISLSNGGSGIKAITDSNHNHWDIINRGTIGRTSSSDPLLHDGIEIDDTAGTGGPSSVDNYGSITGAADAGVILGRGGTVINEAGGIIEGQSQSITIRQFVGMVINHGLVGGDVSNDNEGVNFTGGGTVINTGQIIVGGFGVTFNGQTAGTINTVDNSGRIFSAVSRAVRFDTGSNNGVIINRQGGILEGDGSRAIQFLGTTGTADVENAGTIINNTSSTVSAGGAIEFVNSTASSVTNTSTGIISSTRSNTNTNSQAIRFINGSGVVNNAGTISNSLVNINLAIPGIAAAIRLDQGGIINNSVGGVITNSIINSTNVTGYSIYVAGASGSVNNSGSINGDVRFTTANDQFSMSGNVSHMTGQLLMGTGGNETATFQNVSDANIGTISVFNGGGGGNDQLNFIRASHTGGNDLINWETINLNNNSALTLDSNLTLGGVSSDLTATLNINSSMLNANLAFNSIIQANTARPVLVNNNFGNLNLTSPQGNNSLIIRGNYIGQYGKMNLGAVLFTDGSPADKLVIDGQNGGANASGLTTITAHNLGGVGALTTGNGILVVQAINGATTNPGSFALMPVRGGIYDYRIFRGGLDPNASATAQDWFLRSSFGNGQPIWGPELSVYGAALPTAMDIGRVTLGTLQEREGDEQSLASNACLLDKHFASGGWVRVFDQPYHEDYSSIVDPSASGNVSGVQTGFDLYRDKNDNGTVNLLGVYAAYAQANPDIDGVVTNAAATGYVNQHTGSVNLDSRTGGVYLTHFWCNGSYVDVVAQATNYIGDANTDRTSLSLHGEGTTESAELGYPITFARQWQLEPQGQIMYQYANFHDGSDAFSTVDLGSTDALLGRAGLRLKYNAEFNRCLVQPYVRANFWSVLNGNNASAKYAGFDSVTTTAKANWAQLGGGVTVNFTHNFGVYGFADDLVSLGGNNKLTGMDAGLGVRAFL